MGFFLSIFVVESLVFRGGGGDSEADREPDVNQQQLYSIRKHLYFDYLNVYFVELQDKDASDLGFETITKCISETDQMTFEDLMTMRIGMLWK